MYEKISLSCKKCKQSIFSVSLSPRNDLFINKEQIMDNSVLNMINEATKRVVEQEKFFDNLYDNNIRFN